MFWFGPLDSLQLFRATLFTLRRQLERETGRMPSGSEGFAAMLDHVTLSWGGREPHALRFELGLRDGRPPLLAHAANETLVPRE